MRVYSRWFEKDFLFAFRHKKSRRSVYGFPAQLCYCKGGKQPLFVPLPDGEQLGADLAAPGSGSMQRLRQFLRFRDYILYDCTSQQHGTLFSSGRAQAPCHSRSVAAGRGELCRRGPRRTAFPQPDFLTKSA